MVLEVKVKVVAGVPFLYADVITHADRSHISEGGKVFTGICLSVYLSARYLKKRCS